MTPPPAGPWTDQGPQTDLLPQGHRIMQLSTSFRHLSCAESKAPSAHMSFPVQASPQKGEAVPAGTPQSLGAEVSHQGQKSGAETVFSHWHFTNACASTVNSPPVPGASFWHSQLDWHRLVVVLSINVNPFPKVLYATILAKLFKATQIYNLK